MNDVANFPAELDPATRQTLLEIARRYGTPTYAFDMRRLRAQAEKLRTNLPAAVEIHYSLKANASLGICDVLADCGLGADVASAGELATAVAAGFPPERIFVAGPFKLPETISQLREMPAAIVSVDSPSELQMLVEREIHNRVVLRLRPDFSSSAVCAAGCESRFGFTGDDLERCVELTKSRGPRPVRERRQFGPDPRQVQVLFPARVWDAETAAQVEQRRRKAQRAGRSQRQIQ